MEPVHPQLLSRSDFAAFGTSLLPVRLQTHLSGLRDDPVGTGTTAATTTVATASSGVCFILRKGSHIIYPGIRFFV